MKSQHLPTKNTTDISIKVQEKSSGSESIADQHQNEAFFMRRLDKMYKCPGNEILAEIHKKATTFGYIPHRESGQVIPICACCGLQVNNLHLPICTSTTPTLGEDGIRQTFLMQSGPAMFFTFIKLTTFYLLILFLVVSLFSLNMSIVNEEFCWSYPEECGTSKFVRYSPAKNQDIRYVQNLDILDLLNLVMVGLSIIVFQFYRKYQYDIYGMLDLHNETQDDFTLLVKEIPLIIQKSEKKGEPQVNYQLILKELFEEKIKIFLNEMEENQRNSNSLHRHFHQIIIDKKGFEPRKMDIVKSVSLCYDLSQLQKIMNLREEFMEAQMQKGKSVQQQKADQMEQHDKLETIPDKVRYLNDQTIQMSKCFLDRQSLGFNVTHFVGKALVSLQFEHYRDYLFALYEKNSEEFKIAGKPIKINIATNPQDILWFNMKVDQWTRLLKIVQSFFILFFVLVVTFGIMTSLEVQQESLGKIQSQFQDDLAKQGFGYGTTVFMALITYAINYILAKIITFLTDRERHETKTKYLISIIIKILVSQFFNTAGVYFLLSFNQGHHYLQDDGLVVQISNLMVISGLISVPLNFFQIDSKLFRLWDRIKYGIRNRALFQVQMNAIAQLPEFDFADRYSYYLLQLYTLLFYSYINPICVPAIIIIFFCHYWIDKYNLFKCSSMTVELNFVISRWMLKLFELSLLIFAAGNYYFSWKLHYESSKLINLIALLIASGYSAIAVFSPSYIESKIFGGQHEMQCDSYTNCLERGKFKQLYWSLNPVTRFIEERNINRQNEFVSHKLNQKIADAVDMNNHMHIKTESIT